MSTQSLHVLQDLAAYRKVLTNDDQPSIAATIEAVHEQQRMTNRLLLSIMGILVAVLAVTGAAALVVGVIGILA
ncbi:MAG: hypothetical protein P8076_03225 [Gammaproteobacteria bacterium]